MRETISEPMLDTYIVQPNHNPQMTRYKFQVTYKRTGKAVAYTVTRELAESYARQMRENGYIEWEAI